MGFDLVSKGLILFFLLFVFFSVPPEIISLRFHHQTYLLDDQPVLASFL